MRAEPEESDGVDFKPFFDMIVGVLFILLILISAQMFFARSALQQASETEPQRHALQRQKEIELFLAHLVERLRGHGLAAQVDRVRNTIKVPLADLAEPGRGGTERFDDARIRDLGGELSSGLQCVSTTEPRRPDCPDLAVLRIGAVQADVIVPAPPPDNRLPRDRYAQLVGTLFSAAMLARTPELLAVTGTGGVPAVRFGAAADLGPPNRPAGPASLRLQFVFEP